MVNRPSDSAGEVPAITVLTATYNRQDLLPRLFRSLQAQTCRDFEWLVVDDGSTDQTESLIQRLRGEADFPVRYVKQENGGRHVAVNTGVATVRGRYCAIVDSDDWYPPTGLERMLEHWGQIPEREQDSFASVEGLTAFEGGQLACGRFPADVFDSDSFAREFIHGVRGDTRGMHRTEVLKEFPFPEGVGRYLQPAVIWNRIAERYRTRFVNEVLGYVEYQPDGWSRLGRAGFVAAPAASLIYHRDLAVTTRPLPLRLRFRSSANWCRFSLHMGDGVSEPLRDAPTRLMALAALPAGVALYLHDRHSLLG